MYKNIRIKLKKFQFFQKPQVSYSALLYTTMLLPTLPIKSVNIHRKRATEPVNGGVVAITTK